MKTLIKSEYAAPQCAVHEIQPEGTLCTSMRLFFQNPPLEQLDEDDIYEW